MDISSLINLPPPLGGGHAQFHLVTMVTRNNWVCFTDGPVPVVCMYIEGGSGSIAHACLSVENDLPIVAVNHSGRAANVLSMAFKSDGLKRYVLV